MPKTFRGKGFTLIMPDYSLIVRQTIKEFLPFAGKYVVGRMRDKIGTYQPGWASLKDSTRARKARKLRGSRRVRQVRMGWGTDTPLLDEGKMRNSVHSTLKAQSVEVTADFPMGQHEQDPLIAQFKIAAGNHLPARPVMGPAMIESMPPLIQQFEDLLGSKV
jgi:hypothetical protein